MTPILYLHGVGRTVRAGAWLTALDAALIGHGAPAQWSAEQLVAPDYVDLLREGGRASDVAPPTPTYDADRARQARAGFMAERSLLARRLDPTGRGGGRALPGVVYETGRHTWGVLSPSMRHVEGYRRHGALRRRVLRRVLDDLAAHLGDLDPAGRREIVVVAHSLGSLVALDLLPYLPDGLRVRRLVTLGSPAGWPSLHRGSGRGDDQFPYDRVDSWVNLHSPRDLVPLGRGSARLFPAAVDVRADLPTARHAAELYVGVPVFGRVLAEALGPRGAGPLPSPALGCAP